MKEFTVIRQRPGRIGLRTAQATGAVLTGVLLASCGQASGEMSATVPAAQPAPPPAAKPAPPAAAPAPAATPSTQDSASTSSVAAPQEQDQPKQQATVDRCHTSMLTGTLEAGNPGAGQRYADLVLRNDSPETCNVYGYGGLQLIGEDGTPLPTDLSRTPNPGPELVQLAPGESASATLHWSAVPHGDEPIDGPCAPTPARAQVIPPDETDPLPVEWSFGPVCGQGSMDGTAYH